MSKIKDKLDDFANDNKGTNPEEQNIRELSELVDEKDEYLEAPKSYEEEIAKTFCKLPFDWRCYLHTREKEVDKGFSDLRERALLYKWLDDIYTTRSDELQKDGINSSDDWLKKMVEIDTMLSKNPTDTINMLAVSYGIDNSQKLPYSAKTEEKMSEFISKQLIEKQLNDFIGEIDDNGGLKHPFFYEVIKDMHDLISKNIVKDLPQAYETAVWLNSSTRNKLIEKRVKEALAIKSKDAQKSKEAGFSPKGKAPELKRDLSLREELEMRFAELGNDF